MSNGDYSSLPGFPAREHVDQHPSYCSGDKCSDTPHPCHEPCSVRGVDAGRGGCRLFTFSTGTVKIFLATCLYWSAIGWTLLFSHLARAPVCRQEADFLTLPLQQKRDPQLSRSALELASRFALTTTFV